VVTLREIELILSTTRRTGARVLVKLRGSKYSIAMDRELRAVDQEGKSVPWGSAFPTAPQQVIEAYGIKEIEIQCGGQRIHVTDWKSLLEALKNIKCT